MKKPKHKKPEFGVGQVVVRKKGGFLFRVESRRWLLRVVGKDTWQYLTPHYRQYDEDELRPLTTKEIGPKR